MRKLFINSIRQEIPGHFVLWSRKGEDKPEVQDIGNYLEVELAKFHGVTGELTTPAGPKEIRTYDLCLIHSASHCEGNCEIVRFDCPAATVDPLLKKREPGDRFRLRPVLVQTNNQGGRWKWFILAVDGQYLWKDKLHEVPHSKYEFLYGKGES